MERRGSPGRHPSAAIDPSDRRVAQGGAGHDRHDLRHAVALRRGERDAAAETHDVYAVGHFEDIGHVVANEHNGRAALAIARMRSSTWPLSRTPRRLIHDDEAAGKGGRPGKQ
jgi:hypothetical protein